MCGEMTSSDNLHYIRPPHSGRSWDEGTGGASRSLRQTLAPDIIPAMKVSELGEFGLINVLNEVVQASTEGMDSPSPLGFELSLGIGDDTAVWHSSGIHGLYTTDTVVEGVHFTRETTPWYDLGWKLMAANVSDIAAMGGQCLYALVTLGLPPDTDADDLRVLYEGMAGLGNKYGVKIAGGDIVRSPVVFATVALTGAAEKPPMLRSKATPGDQVAVTGYVGSSAGGLELLLSGIFSSSESADFLVSAHRRPEPCIQEGRTLLQHGVTTAMDVSDGLADDLSKLCTASGVSATIEAGDVPVHPALREVFPERCLDLALGGGEDYQLVFAADESLMAEVVPLLSPSAAVIGRITAGEPGTVRVVDSRDGTTRNINAMGWDHFRSPSPAEAK